MNLHLGFIHTLVFSWCNSPTGAGKETDEIVSVAYIEAERLLREKYDPKHGKVTTFLRSYLMGRVEYQVGKDQGLRKRSGGWKNDKQLHKGGTPYNPQPSDSLEFDELVAMIHPDFRQVAEDLAEGLSLLEIVKAMGLDSFDFYDDLDEDIPIAEAREIAVAELRQMMRAELRPTT